MTRSHANKGLIPLSMAAIGIVFGDIGTSPMYALSEALSEYPLTQTPDGVLGVVSLIIWSLILIVCLKYLMFITLADNEGEGGIFAIVTLLRSDANFPTRHYPLIVAIGVASAALLFSDSLITPALSIMAAVEGTKSLYASADDWVVPISLCVLVLLFSIQKYGTTHLSRVFSPVMIIWFLAIGGYGVKEILQNPQVLKALSPVFAYRLLLELHWNEALNLLGSVLLAVTGAEAIYADMGHFGRRPISLGWYAIALQALMLSYLGQAARVLGVPVGSAEGNPFFATVPPTLMFPTIILGTLASVIASQAVISGMFSLARQAILLGYLPRLDVRQTSDHRGQIYVPKINLLLFVGCTLLVLGFRSSSALASAYGFAVSATMLLTTTAFTFVLLYVWRWSWLKALAFCVFALPLDVLFFGATLTKLPAGHFLPLIISLTIIWLLYAWIKGTRQLMDRAQRIDIPVPLFAELIEERADLVRLSRPAVFLQHLPFDAGRQITPTALMRQIQVTSVLYQPCIIVDFIVADSPRLAASNRIEHSAFENNIHLVHLRSGFREPISIEPLVDLGRRLGWWRDGADVVYFSCREEIRAASRPLMNPAIRWPYLWLHGFDLSVPRTLDIPALQYVELGLRIDL